MDIEKHEQLFNTISPLYNLFYNHQFKHYLNAIEKHGYKLNIPENGSILDLGCGTGAFGGAFRSAGYEATGIDIASSMIQRGLKRGLKCFQGNPLEGLDFPDDSFDLVASAFVIHGLDREKRLKFFREASRLSRGFVLFHDYNSRRHWLINIIEALEKGDYFNFVRNGFDEMKEVFSSVERIPIREFSSWYICKK